MRKTVPALMATALMTLTLTLTLPLAGCGGGNAPDAGAARAPAGPRLTLATSETADWQDVSAEVSTVDRAQVLARIPGILSVLNVRAGDMVRKGQVIGRIADSQLAYQAGAYGAQAAAAEAQATQARADLDRVRFLYQNGVYARARLEQAEAAAGASGAQVHAARAQQAAVNAVAGQGAVVAPASGRVLRADIPAGSPVAPGMAVAVITAGPVVLRLEMPEALAGKVRVGSHVLADYPEGSGGTTGTVTRIYPDVETGQVAADVALPGLDDRFIGRRIAAKVEAGQRKALLVPAAFVTRRYGIDYVTVVSRDGSASEVPVQTAPSAETGRLEILSGVSAGDVLAAPAAQGRDAGGAGK